MEDDTTISIRLSEHEPGTATRRQARALVDLLTEKLGAQGNGSWAAEGIRLDIRGTMATAFFLDELLAGAGRLACERGMTLAITGSDHHSSGIVEHIIRTRGLRARHDPTGGYAMTYGQHRQHPHPAGVATGSGEEMGEPA